MVSSRRIHSQLGTSLRLHRSKLECIGIRIQLGWRIGLLSKEFQRSHGSSSSCHPKFDLNHKHQHQFDRIRNCIQQGSNCSVLGKLGQGICIHTLQYPSSIRLWGIPMGRIPTNKCLSSRPIQMDTLRNSLSGIQVCIHMHMSRSLRFCLLRRSDRRRSKHMRRFPSQTFNQYQNKLLLENKHIRRYHGRRLNWLRMRQLTLKRIGSGKFGHSSSSFVGKGLWGICSRKCRCQHRSSSQQRKVVHRNGKLGFHCRRISLLGIVGE